MTSDGSAAHEQRKAGASEADAMETMGQKSPSMYRRYSDLFSREEKIQRQKEVQERRRQWQESQPNNLVMMKTGSTQ